MKSIFAALVLSSFVSPQAYGALDMKPGLWKVDLKIKAAGKEIDSEKLKQMKAMMDSIPEAQRKQMAQMMGKMGGKDMPDMNQFMGPKGDIQICYTKEILDKPENMGNYEKNRKCDFKVKSSSSTQVETDFKCEDGTEGSAHWKILSPETYEGTVSAKTKRGLAEIKHKGTFVSADCGKVKPFGKAK
ncbi:MAG: DUF3617 domain-containing protein [Bdellovibrionales bacterium]|nr:DUF3617 domain-containing protein [Bdellovibrionales bacterium]